MAKFLIQYQCMTFPVIHDEDDQGATVRGMRLVTGCHTYKTACDKLKRYLHKFHGEHRILGKDSFVLTNLTI